jgi:hypothetical protein
MVVITIQQRGKGGREGKERTEGGEVMSYCRKILVCLLVSGINRVAVE